MLIESVLWCYCWYRRGTRSVAHVPTRLSCGDGVGIGEDWMLTHTESSRRAPHGIQTIITRSITTTKQVEIFEARRFVGGKVGSWVDKVRCVVHGIGGG